jgi:hypothetical protein
MVEEVVDASRISTGERVAGVAALALLITLWLPWYSASAFGDSESVNAWESFDLIDVILFLVAILTIALVAMRAAGSTPELPAPPGALIAGGGAIATILVLYRILDIPGEADIAGIDIGREVGVFFALIASAAVAFGGYTAMNEDPVSTPSTRP